MGSLASDEVLVESALGGDRDAFDTLVGRHRGAALRTAAFIVGADRGQDVVQDALLLAFRALPTLRDRTKFQRWLLTITRFKALRVSRIDSNRRAGTIPLDDALLKTLSDLACDPREERPGDGLLRGAIEEIPPAYAAVIRLHFLHGLPHRKISDLLGVSLPTVKWRCARGKELIRDIIRPGTSPIARLETGCKGCRREGRPVTCGKHAVVKAAPPDRSSPDRTSAAVPRKAGVVRRPALAVVLAALALLGAVPVRAGGAAAGRAATEAKSPRYSRKVAEYAVPDVKLVDQTGRSVGLAELLAADKPVALNFFFASCGSICPVMTSTLARMRKDLGHDGDGLRVVSVTIDPDQDTPAILKAYAKEYSAGKGWSFLTGDAEKISEVQRAFLADAGGKFNHQLLYFFRAAGSKSWVRVEGLANAADLAGEVRGLVSARPTKS